MGCVQGGSGSLPLSFCTVSCRIPSPRPFTKTCMSSGSHPPGHLLPPQSTREPSLDCTYSLGEIRTSSGASVNISTLDHFQCTSDARLTTRMSFLEPLTLNKTRTKLIISPPSLSPSSTCHLSESASQISGVSLEPSLCLPHSTVHQSPSTQSQNLGVALQSTVIS